MQWPPDYIKEAKRRKVLSDAFWSLDDPRAEFKKRYKDNPVAFINDWCWTEDPRNADSNNGLPVDMPFLLFPKQVELIKFFQDCAENKQDGLVEKCRAMGASWCAIAYSVHQWLFVTGFKAGFGSQIWDNADKVGDTDSLLEKARYTIDRLPPFAKPESYERSKHAPMGRIKNPENGSLIKAGGGTNIGRGGRTSMYFVDEAAHLEQPEQVHASLSRTTNVRIEISSVAGTGNLFYRRAHSPYIKKFIMDWRDHPAQTQEWYDQEKAKFEAEGSMHVFAQEIERDYTAAVEGIIIKGSWVRSAIDAHIKLGFDDAGSIEGGLDVADEGGDTNALAIRHGVVLKHISEWGDCDGDETAMTALVTCAENDCRTIRYDKVGVGADVRTGFKKLDTEGFTIIPYNGGDGVMNPEQFFVPGIKNKNHFENLKAQDWWNLRTRFYKTHRMMEGKDEYSHDELISLSSDIPLLQKLVNELSRPTKTASKRGLTMIDKKPKGTKSPNLADAVVMAYSSVGPKKIRMAFN